jgi:hypothetical protein
MGVQCDRCGDYAPGTLCAILYRFLGTESLAFPLVQEEKNIGEFPLPLYLRGMPLPHGGAACLASPEHPVALPFLFRQDHAQRRRVPMNLWSPA